ncbi:MAG: ASKHA domain-containing protein [bacterium]
MSSRAAGRPGRTTHYNVLFLPEGLRARAAAGTTVLAAAAQEGLVVPSTCGGKGTCGKCLVRAGAAGTSGKALRTVLACQTLVEGDMVADMALVAVAVHRKTELNELARAIPATEPPPLVKLPLDIPRPTLGQPTPDAERLVRALAAAAPGGRQDAHTEVPLEVLRALPAALHQGGGRVTAVLHGGRLLAVEPGDTSGRCFGVAVDLGTTSVAATLVDLNTRATLASGSAANRQSIHGADVVSRINYCVTEPDGAAQLQSLAVNVINELIGQSARRAGVEAEEIHRVVVVGNPTMCHLLLGLSPARLAVAPFVQVAARTVVAQAREVGLRVAPRAAVVVLPNIGGFVGSDTVGVILATGLNRGDTCRLAVDIGTNGEIVVATPRGLLACATAAGPAFEGAQVRHGMYAAEGAIEKITVGDDVAFRTIGGRPALGLCGSGLIDAVAGLVRAGAIAPSGRMKAPEEREQLPERLGARLGRDEDGVFFVIARPEESALEGPVVLTQKDVRALQLSKAAIRAGIEVLLATGQITAADLGTVYLAGAFGNYIDRRGALAIGLLPRVPLRAIRAAGNAAGQGAQWALLSQSAVEEAQRIAEQTRYVDLSTSKIFHHHFMAALNFPAASDAKRRKGHAIHRRAAR